MDETPAFDDAVDQLKRFLARQSWPGLILWASHDDVAFLPGARTVVRRRPLLAARESARAHYEAGRQQGLGVALDVFCALRGAACATVYWSTDAVEAMSRMMPARGLKLSVTLSRRPATSAGPVLWWLAKRRAVNQF